MITKWDRRFIELARHIAGWSKDPSTQVGAVIVSGNKIMSTGYNGFPSGMDDNRMRDRDFKIKHVVHAEMNAIFNARCDIRGATLYVSHPMCSECAKLVGAAGISRVVWPQISGDETFVKRWKSNDAEDVLSACGIKVEIAAK